MTENVKIAKTQTFHLTSKNAECFQGPIRNNNKYISQETVIIS